MNGGPIRLAALAAELGRELEGDGGLELRGAASLAEAGPDELAFVRGRSHAAALAASRAGAVIAPGGVETGARPTIRSPHPQLDFARAVRRILPPPRPPRGVHAAAWVDPTARIDPSASVGAGAVVGARARVGARSVVHANATLYADVEVGADCELHAACVLREGTRLGDRVVLQPGVVLGGDGFGFVLDEQGAWVAMPQLGRVVVEDDVEIGANSAVDRGTFGETRIGRGAKLDDLVMVAHNCTIGAHAVLLAQSGVAGSSRLGERAVLMPQAGVKDHVSLGAGVFVAPRSGVSGDLPDGARVGGMPHVEYRRYWRMMLSLRKLPEVLARLRRLERRVGAGDEGADA